MGGSDNEPLLLLEFVAAYAQKESEALSISAEMKGQTSLAGSEGLGDITQESKQQNRFSLGEQCAYMMQQFLGAAQFFLSG